MLDTQALVGIAARNPQLLASASREAGNGNPLEFAATGTALEDFTQLELLPAQLQEQPVDLTLTSDYKFGDARDLTADELPVLSVGSGAQILGEVGASITLASDTSLFVDGRIDAPAGQIALELDSSFSRYAPQQMIWLGPQAHLSARGAAVLTPNELGFRQGVVLDAGEISLQANYGSIVTTTGSRIDVDGVATTLDLATGAGGAITPTVIAGRAGSIQLTAAESILLQGELSGRAARAGDMGGVLAVTLDPTHGRLIGKRGHHPTLCRWTSVTPAARASSTWPATTGDPERDAAIAADLTAKPFCRRGGQRGWFRQSAPRRVRAGLDEPARSRGLAGDDPLYRGCESHPEPQPHPGCADTQHGRRRRPFERRLCRTRFN